MVKRIISLSLSVVILLSGCAYAESAAETETEQYAETYQLETKSFPWYISSKSNKMDAEDSFPLWFADGADDLPFMELKDWAQLMTILMAGSRQTPAYDLMVEIKDDGGCLSMTRENGYNAIFNFDDGTIIYEDYIAFTSINGSKYMDPVDFQGADPEGKPFLLSTLDSRERYGTITTVDLKKYGIPMIAQDGHYLLPLQTLSTFFMYPLQIGTYFNGEAVFISQISDMADPWEEFERNLQSSDLMTLELLEMIENHDGPEAERRESILETVSAASEDGSEMVEQYRQADEESLYNIYTSASGAKRSDALIDFSYRELCLDLDCFYGLKDSHSISDFETFFLQTGLSEGLTSPDAAKADAAVSDLAYYWFDDGHSGFISPSWMEDSSPETNLGFSNQATSDSDEAVSDIRDKYPNAALPYYEVGDTAYITFDEFLLASSPEGYVDYYALNESGEELPEDTISIIINAHKQITRENSPIKNVVLDMSCNGGGQASAGAYLICWFLGDAHFSIHNTFTNSQSTLLYRADVNLDREFDENDTLAGRGLNLYCLISPSSFSCGNLVPWAFKEDGSVNLLGKVSGGGSCVVRYLTTGWGTSFQLSGTDRLSFVKNGSYYDVDQGVSPDHIIDSYDHFYDREALTDYIHSLY